MLTHEKHNMTSKNTGQLNIFDSAPACLKNELQSDANKTIYNRVINSPFCNTQGRDVTHIINIERPVRYSLT